MIFKMAPCMPGAPGASCLCTCMHDVLPNIRTERERHTHTHTRARAHTCVCQSHANMQPIQQQKWANIKWVARAIQRAEHEHKRPAHSNPHYISKKNTFLVAEILVGPKRTTESSPQWSGDRTYVTSVTAIELGSTAEVRLVDTITYDCGAKDWFINFHTDTVISLAKSV